MKNEDMLLTASLCVDLLKGNKGIVMGSVKYGD